MREQNETHMTVQPDEATGTASSLDTCCVNCEQVLEKVFRHDVAPTFYQFQNALWIGFFGGYGMYVDELSDLPYGTERVLPGRPDFEAVLCGNCADELVKQHPWMQRLFTSGQK